jgi:5-methylcytosine-specific restriction endonuclease McrA
MAKISVTKERKRQRRRERKALLHLSNEKIKTIADKLIAGDLLDHHEQLTVARMPKAMKKVVVFRRKNVDLTLALRSTAATPRLDTPSRSAYKPSAPSQSDRQAFYASDEWRRLRYQAILRSKGCCEACGMSRKDGIVLHVDHVKPISIYPHLKLILANLQVLCKDCNLGKGAWDETDWRDGAPLHVEQ